MRQIALTTLGLITLTTVHAASFDCGKARTEVEKLICGNPELSRLDEELGRAYKAALNDGKHAAQIARAQKQWINFRDQCRETKCVKRSYETRLGMLRYPLIDGVSAGTPRAVRDPGYTATVLPNGQVLVVGRAVSPPTPEQYAGLDAEIFDPDKSRFIATGATITEGRTNHIAILLPNNKVMLGGGSVPVQSKLGNDPCISDVEIYDIRTGKFSEAGHFLIPRCNFTATLLLDGRVLIAGGCDEVGNNTRDAELYDPATGRFTATGRLVTARSYHTATLMQNGKVLIVGGGKGDEPARAEIYDPATGVFSVSGAPQSSFSSHTATLLPNGKVLVVGGEHWSEKRQILQVNDAAELYDPSTGQFSPGGKLNEPRYTHSAILLKNGKVLIAGGGATSGSSLELYDPSTRTFSRVGLYADGFGLATLLKDGRVFLMGEKNADLYTPGQ
jgi:uncharacterized protein YecT (DUF1311 family)